MLHLHLHRKKTCASEAELQGVLSFRVIEGRDQCLIKSSLGQESNLCISVKEPALISIDNRTFTLYYLCYKRAMLN